MPDATIYTIIGASGAIAASVFNAVGYTVQKKGHNNLKEYNKNKDEKDQKKLVKEKTWIIGFSIYLIGGLLNAVSLFFAPQSLVLPLSAITLVVNTMLATKMLGEPFFKVDILGILLVIIGSTLAVIFGPRTAGGQTSMKELEKRWADMDFFIFFIVLSGVVFVTFLGIRYYERLNFVANDVTNKIKYGSTYLLLSYCFVAGYFGANAFLFLKSFTEFIGSSVSSTETAHENFRNWYSYITLIFVVISNFLLEFFRQRGLSYFHAVYVVPINQVLLIVLGTVLGGIYFREFENLSTLNLSLFIVAILLTVCGVFILAFNSGNITEKTDEKIVHTITASIDLQNLNLQNLPSIKKLTTAPSLPIERNMDDSIPEINVALPFAVHGIHRSLTAMQFQRDGKPFYFNPDLYGHGIHDNGGANDNNLRVNGRTRMHSVPSSSGHSNSNINANANGNGKIHGHAHANSMSHTSNNNYSRSSMPSLYKNSGNGSRSITNTKDIEIYMTKVDHLKNGKNGQNGKNSHSQNDKNGAINIGITPLPEKCPPQNSHNENDEEEDDMIEIITRKSTVDLLKHDNE